MKKKGGEDTSGIWSGFAPNRFPLTVDNVFHPVGSVVVHFADLTGNPGPAPEPCLDGLPDSPVPADRVLECHRGVQGSTARDRLA